MCLLIAHMIWLAFIPLSIFLSFSRLSKNYFKPRSPILFLNTNFSVSNSIISSANFLNAFLIAGNIAKFYSPLLGCVKTDFDFESFILVLSLLSYLYQLLQVILLGSFIKNFLLFSKIFIRIF